MKKISILGCGWLGLPLAKSLLSKGFSVKGSTTSLEKMSTLKNTGIDAFQIALSENEISGKIDSFLSNSEILIIDIPPKLRGNTAENFVAKMERLIPFIEKNSVQKVIFVSSTSVYSDDNSTITEETKPQPDSESGKQLLEAENLLQSNPNFKTTVIRFGGLIGKDRHPIRLLAGRQNLKNPDAPINLIHQVDCIGIIENIIEQNCFGETFNAVGPFHPTRKEYYTKKALGLNLPLPLFDESNPSVGKTILSDKIEVILGYEFQNQNLSI
ncbi:MULTISPECIES: SDR family oxidoreductase [unclassified Flavobacterium]|uniref:SDR family oxidoreductase n=1 Tax=unclassified Flavobacterium TaxID=196869 RepID=UPI000EAB7289|nr:MULTISPECIES: SDR family oxidoreductase [unclassified Flavobacterium]RKS01189.1 nucleoside-diphosphate-sugar epimerase [Flavobacterium sp. 102]